MIKTRKTKYHEGSRVDIIGLLPSFNDYERVEIRFQDNGSTTWINAIYLTEDKPGEIQAAIDALKEKGEANTHDPA